MLSQSLQKITDEIIEFAYAETYFICNLLQTLHTDLRKYCAVCTDTTQSLCKNKPCQTWDQIVSAYAYSLIFHMYCFAGPAIHFRRSCIVCADTTQSMRKNTSYQRWGLVVSAYAYPLISLVIFRKICIHTSGGLTQHAQMQVNPCARTSLVRDEAYLSMRMHIKQLTSLFFNIPAN